MAKATGLISSLFNVASSGDMPFHQLQQLQCLYHGSTEAYLCSPLSSIPLSIAAQVKICGMHIMASVRDQGKCRASRGASYDVILRLEYLSNMFEKQNEAQCDEQLLSDMSTFKLINNFNDLTFRISVLAGLIVELLFMLFSVYNAAFWAENECI